MGPVTYCGELYKDLPEFVEGGLFPGKLFRKGCAL